MNKSWGEIRSETLNLGFEKIKAYDKNKSAYIQAYNWAQNLISSTVGGIIRTYEFDGGILDVTSLENEFLALSQMGIRDKNTNRRVDEAAFLDNRFIVSPQGVKTVVYFYSTPDEIDEYSPDNTVCPLPYKWANLMPYLMANRLFLDDDAAKSGYYWNLYEDMKNQILSQENLPVATINSEYKADL